MLRLRLFVAAGAALLVTGTVVSAGGAQASSGTSRAAMARAALAALQKLHLHTVPHADASPSASLTQTESYNWAGYADAQPTSGTVTYRAVSAYWKVPVLKCTSEDRIASFWVGIDGFASTSTSVEQAGTLGQCFEGSAYYYTWWEMTPTNSTQIVGTSVAGNDQIKADISLSGTTYTLAVTDSTHTANSFSVKEHCGSGVTCQNSSAEVIGERPEGNIGVFPLAEFARYTASGVVVDSTTTTGNLSTFADNEITMIDGTGTYSLATPGTLSGGTSFTITWDNSY